VGEAPPLETQNLGHSFGELDALSDLSLMVAAGECVVLLGANGSGKSTAVRTVSGLLEPTRGSVRVCGHDPHSEPDGESARALLALVPDSPLLYADLSVREHLGLVVAAHGVADADDRVDWLLERMGIAARADFQPTQLSRGMRQKTQLACAFVRPASLLVLDEPVVGLDPPSQLLLREMLFEAKAAGTGVLMTTHQLPFVAGLADRALLLQDGEVVSSGAFDEVAAYVADLGWSEA
jgi:ABC-2 type transport system ATP-binding protein